MPTINQLVRKGEKQRGKEINLSGIAGEPSKERRLHRC